MPVAGSGEEVKMTGDFSQFDLMREIADSERQKPWSAGIHARILTKNPDFRVVLISMETAARLKEHHVDGTSSVAAQEKLQHRNVVWWPLRGDP
jgi:hypothetical protein